MPGETDLKVLLENLFPEQVPGDYVFCCLSTHHLVIPEKIIGSFREEEGITFILSRETADVHGLAYDSIMAWVCLKVHSSLQAVGLTAAVSAALANEGISCNIVAAYYHDHLFVPKKAVGRALSILQQLGS